MSAAFGNALFGNGPIKAESEGSVMWEELGISGGTAIIVLIALYFVVKWAVKNGITEAYEKIKGKETIDDLDKSETET